MRRVFLAHRRDDLEWAVRVRRALVRKGFDVWLDGYAIGSGDSATRHIIEAIEKADALLAIVSRHPFRGSWVEAEIQYARRRGLPVALLRVERTPHPPGIPFHVGFDLFRAQGDPQGDFESAMGRLVQWLARMSGPGPGRRWL